MVMCVDPIIITHHQGDLEGHSFVVLLSLFAYHYGERLILLTQSILGWAPVALGLGLFFTSWRCDTSRHLLVKNEWWRGQRGSDIFYLMMVDLSIIVFM